MKDVAECLSLPVNHTWLLLQVWNQLGLCRTSVGHLGDAVKAFHEAVKLDPAFYEAWLNMGQASKEVGSSDIPGSS
jgi:lipoprotein NlpI